MENVSISDSFLQKINSLVKQKLLSQKYAEILSAFYLQYKEEAHISKNDLQHFFEMFFSLLEEQFKKPYSFELYHKQIVSPFDYYQFGLDFLYPLIDSKSKVSGLQNVEKMQKQLKSGENVILLANHQSEIDPQAISILLKDSYPNFAKEIIFVAGERVVTDPLAIPFSMGRNLLCIYSKRYIDNPPELKEDKQNHNKRTMEAMRELLSRGGIAIYVAPSGGRDRIDENEKLSPAPFDPNSVEMFFLMAKKAKTPTHFYPLALFTYHLMPPPDNIQKELGERRSIKYSTIKASFGEEINLEALEKEKGNSTTEYRQKKCDYIFNLVKQEWEKIYEN